MQPKLTVDEFEPRPDPAAAQAGAASLTAIPETCALEVFEAACCCDETFEAEHLAECLAQRWEALA